MCERYLIQQCMAYINCINKSQFFLCSYESIVYCNYLYLHQSYHLLCKDINRYSLWPVPWRNFFIDIIQFLESIFLKKNWNFTIWHWNFLRNIIFSNTLVPQRHYYSETCYLSILFNCSVECL